MIYCTDKNNDKTEAIAGPFAAAYATRLCESLNAERGPRFYYFTK